MWSACTSTFGPQLAVMKSAELDVAVPIARTVLLHCSAVQSLPMCARQPVAGPVIDGCHQIGQRPQVEQGRKARIVPT